MNATATDMERPKRQGPGFHQAEQFEMFEQLPKKVDLTVPQKPGCLPEGYSENSILTLAQMCVWQQLGPKVVCRRARAGQFPAIRRGKSYRFHVGTVLDIALKRIQNATQKL